MKEEIIKQIGPVKLEKTEGRNEWCVTSEEQHTTVFSYFSDEKKALEHFEKKVAKLKNEL